MPNVLIYDSTLHTSRVNTVKKGKRKLIIVIKINNSDILLTKLSKKFKKF